VVNAVLRNGKKPVNKSTKLADYSRGVSKFNGTAGKLRMQKAVSFDTLLRREW
jgi:hypothetical protein